MKRTGNYCTVYNIKIRKIRLLCPTYTRLGVSFLSTKNSFLSVSEKPQRSLNLMQAFTNFYVLGRAPIVVRSVKNLKMVCSRSRKYDEGDRYSESVKTYTGASFRLKGFQAINKKCINVLLAKLNIVAAEVTGVIVLLSLAIVCLVKITVLNMEAISSF
ncbi:uncharacterized protein EV154DRAFT_555838 [Mucor mucedo]|uniref:uncharacterized protein n=1 Tax=Mucor mucedo TaxID=29922 RepID=UPI00221FF4BA|nr:uncharacterized protein EV154DRAFT_555838 [Mucor mucedo]KAI7875742.1 hypothetical protein EV154DRAFT_555838 [Mucor mucedo]